LPKEQTRKKEISEAENVNIGMGSFRAILIKEGLWARPHRSTD
jgi:hypothetical protein